jgi:hypothetical protein
MFKFAHRILAFSASARQRSFEDAKARADEARARSKAASERLNKYPKGNMGITPDEVKRSPEFQRDKRIFDQAFNVEKQANAFLVKHFKQELAAERKARKGY